MVVALGLNAGWCKSGSAARICWVQLEESHRLVLPLEYPSNDLRTPRVSPCSLTESEII